MARGRVVITDAAQLVVGPANRPHPGGNGPPSDPRNVLEIIESGGIIIEDGQVVATGPADEIRSEYADLADEVIDASEQVVLPGFVDCHTHAIFAGDRSDEFAMKLRGKEYQDILAEGGGILRTVRAVREASDAELRDRLRDHLDVMLAHGTTTVEVKSGYGLDTETELRLLQAIDDVRQNHPIRVAPTFMGAHAVPPDVSTNEYVTEVIDEQLPAVAEQGIAQFCDVFCEDGVFDVEQSKRILLEGRSHGLTPKIHADEFVRLGGASLAAEIGAASADHLLQSTADDAVVVGESTVTPVMLPGTAFGLDTPYARPRRFLDAGAELAIASDFNPNCHAPGMNFTVMLACVGMKLTPAEAIRAATVGGAYALQTDEETSDAVPEQVGSLQTGAPGDLIICDAPSIDHLPYRFGQNLCDTVIIDGEVVLEPSNAM